jgi:hypothetical protein
MYRPAPDRIQNYKNPFGTHSLGNIRLYNPEVKLNRLSYASLVYPVTYIVLSKKIVAI